MLTVRIQAIDGTGTFTLSDSQPCRLLTLLGGPYVTMTILSLSSSLRLAWRNRRGRRTRFQGARTIARAPRRGGARDAPRHHELIDHGDAQTFKDAKAAAERAFDKL